MGAKNNGHIYNNKKILFAPLKDFGDMRILF